MPSGRPPRSAYAANADSGGEGHNAALMPQTQPSPSRGMGVHGDWTMEHRTLQFRVCTLAMLGSATTLSMPCYDADVYGCAGMLSFLRRGGGDGSDPDLNGRHAAALDEMDRFAMLSLANVSIVQQCGVPHVDPGTQGATCITALTCAVTRL